MSKKQSYIRLQMKKFNNKTNTCSNYLKFYRQNFVMFSYRFT